MDTIAFIGLGNPGKKYEQTRHNLGITVLRYTVAELSAHGLLHNQRGWHTDAQLSAELAEYTAVGRQPLRLLAAWPLTSMNSSGEALAALCQRHHLTPDQLLILHDDIELPLGTIKVVTGGSAAGHNGVRSIQRALAVTDIARLRLGVGRPAAGYPVDRYVLELFGPAEQEAVQAMCNDSVSILRNMLEQGRVAA